MKSYRSKHFEIATFAGGCFWCTEAIFKRLRGVYLVSSGYSGGKDMKITYEQVSAGSTGQAEAIQIVFDPHVISYNRLLDIFWATHDPTTMNRQGSDVGNQYRSVIFYHSDKQKAEALESKRKLEKDGIYKDPVVTEIVPYTSFYKAEEYHQGYYEKNRDYPYCSIVISPKIKNLLEKFGKEVKEEFKEA